MWLSIRFLRDLSIQILTSYLWTMIVFSTFVQNVQFASRNLNFGAEWKQDCSRWFWVYVRVDFTSAELMTEMVKLCQFVDYGWPFLSAVKNVSCQTLLKSLTQTYHFCNLCKSVKRIHSTEIDPLDRNWSTRQKLIVPFITLWDGLPSRFGSICCPPFSDFCRCCSESAENPKRSIRSRRVCDRGPLREPLHGRQPFTFAGWRSVRSNVWNAFYSHFVKLLATFGPLSAVSAPIFESNYSFYICFIYKSSN